MKNKMFPAAIARVLVAIRFTVVFLMLFGSTLSAQQPDSSSVQMQREAMRKLSFLVGHWAGPIEIVRGPGQALHLMQTEDVAYKLDGLILLVEGHSTDAENRVRFSALATVAYDDASRSYRLRAYNSGRYLDTQLSVLTDGFSWSFTAGPAHVVNTMHLTEKSEWKEVTEVTVGGNTQEHAAAHRSMEMVLQRRP